VLEDSRRRNRRRRLTRGSGLIGLKDRVEAVGGQLEIASIAGFGTSLSATIPLLDDARRELVVLSNENRLCIAAQRFSIAASRGRGWRLPVGHRRHPPPPPPP